MTDLQKALYQYGQERLVLGLLYRNREEWEQAERETEQAQSRLEALGPEAAALTEQFSQRRLESFCLEEEAVFLADQSGFTDCRKGQIFRAVLFIQPHARPDPRFPFQTVHGFPPLRFLLPHGSSSHIVKSILIPVHPLSADSDHIEPYRNALSQMLSI